MTKEANERAAKAKLEKEEAERIAMARKRLIDDEVGGKKGALARASTR